MIDITKIKDIFFRFRGLTTIGISNLISNGISGLFWLYIARLLGTEQYGLVSYLVAISGIATVLSFLGSGNTLTVYTAKEVKIQPPVYLLAIVSSIVASLILFFIVKNFAVSLFVIGNVVFGLVTYDLLGQKKYKKYSVYLISQKILMTVLSISLYYIFGSDGVVLGIAISFFPMSLISCYNVFRKTKINFSLIKERQGFIFNSYIMDLSRSLSSSLDKLIVAPLFGFVLLGNYQLGIQFLGLLGILPGVLYQYILPHDSTGVQNKKLKLVFIIAAVFIATISITLSPIIVPMIFPRFIEAISIIPILSLHVIPTTINIIYISKFLGNEKSRIVLIGSAIYISVEISMIVILGKIFGINGVAWAIVLAAIIEMLYLLIINKRKNNITNLNQTDDSLT